ncbi:type VII secretion integral membrane protein EccD, partial [Mycobacterium sp. ITM-2017-0098]
RVVTGSVVGLFAVTGVAIAAVLGALLARTGSPRLATALAAAALPSVAAAFALAVPGEFGPANILLGAAGVAAWSVISITVGERAVALF